MAHDVFISYAQNDKPTAAAVCHARVRWTVGLLAIAAAVLVAGGLALRGWIGNEDTAIVIAIVGGAFFAARTRRRR